MVEKIFKSGNSKFGGGKHGCARRGARHMGVSAAQVARLPLPAVAGNPRPHDAQLLPARASAPLRSPLSWRARALMLAGSDDGVIHGSMWADVACEELVAARVVQPRVKRACR